MDIGGRRHLAAAVVIGAIVAVSGCAQTATRATTETGPSGTGPRSTEAITGLAGAAGERCGRYRRRLCLRQA